MRWVGHDTDGWGRYLPIAAGRTGDRLRTLGRARWRGEDSARETREPGRREFAGKLGQSQDSQGATELAFPGPALGHMPGEAAGLASEPSGQGEELPPESLGGCHPFAQTTPRCPSGQVMVWAVWSSRTWGSISWAGGFLQDTFHPSDQLGYHVITEVPGAEAVDDGVPVFHHVY